jgi:hypothetical protein
MKLSRERKVFVTLCGIALGALVIDRALLAPSADPEGADAAAQLAVPSAARAAPGVTPPGGRKGGESAEAANISRLLAQMAEKKRKQLEQTPDAFQPATAWVAPPANAAVPVASDIRVVAFTRRKLASVMGSGRGGAGAMVDGQIVHVGQTLDGFTLLAVDKYTALFEGRGVQVRLSLNGASRIYPAGHVRPHETASSGALSEPEQP